MTYKHLGIYSDWVTIAKAHLPVVKPTQEKLLEVLGFQRDTTPKDVRVENRWSKDGVTGELITWSVGYGPRTEAWVLKPEGVNKPLPAVLALHDHGGYKYHGKEKIADGPDTPTAILESHRRIAYGDRAFANALALEGFIVIVPDVFLWGSRRVPLETFPESMQVAAAATQNTWLPEGGNDGEVVAYNTAAHQHEHLMEKYCSLLGTTFAGMVSYEDRVALDYLHSRPDILAEQIGCIGLSGGGCRAAFLQATSGHISASVVVGLMSTYEGMLDHNVANHTWMLFPATWARFGDYPDIATCGGPKPLLVQYDLDDTLFTREGMYAAHEKITSHYQALGSNNYTGEFYPGPHKFDLSMQQAAFSWLKEKLG